MKRTRSLSVGAAFVAGLLMASTALAVLYIYPGKGVGSARIRMNHREAAKRISSTYKTVRDTRYSYVVYRTYVGKKMSNGRYPIELYSKSDKRVFRFQVNSSRYPTSKGVKIGSAESTVKSKYPKAKKYTSGQYTLYRLKHSIYSFSTYTEFYCKGGKVRFIIVRR